MQDRWRWLLLAACGVAALAWTWKRSRPALSEADAAIYGDESERMQDA